MFSKTPEESDFPADVVNSGAGAVGAGRGLVAGPPQTETRRGRAAGTTRLAPLRHHPFVCQGERG